MSLISSFAGEERCAQCADHLRLGRNGYSPAEGALKRPDDSDVPGHAAAHGDLLLRADPGQERRGARSDAVADAAGDLLDWLAELP